MTQETAEEMCRQLRDRQINTCGVANAVPQEMYMILKVDKGEGFHHVDTSGLQVYVDPNVAREDLSRFLFSAGYAVLPLVVLQEPHLLGTKEQRDAWENRKGNK
jgi:hypothetical protein